MSNLDFFVTTAVFRSADILSGFPLPREPLVAVHFSQRPGQLLPILSWSTLLVLPTSVLTFLD